MIRCPWCTALQHRIEALLGTLGTRRHYRCRYCGGQWSKVTIPRGRLSRKAKYEEE